MSMNESDVKLRDEILKIGHDLVALPLERHRHAQIRVELGTMQSLGNLHRVARAMGGAVNSSLSCDMQNVTYTLRSCVFRAGGVEVEVSAYFFRELDDQERKDLANVASHIGHATAERSL